ncbi:MAG TPA: DNA primase [Chitinophagaceae bacterium]|nr:DNA primase [Chitinophagaceae bacterium]
MITPQTIEQIKSRIDIIDIISQYVNLKKRGSNYIGNCPFHHEKTPSFTVSPTKELYKCFGCGKSGNAITFLMEHDKLSFVEALKWLAAKYNIEIEETETTAEQKIVTQTADSLYILNNFATNFLEKELWQGEEGVAIALTYLKERGFREDIIKKFQLGYNPTQKDKLVTTLLNNQFNKELIPKSGLGVERNQQELVDNYRGRIIFPIHNNTGKIIGFGARVIGNAKDKAPKYINTPENEIYIKSKILYGIYFARSPIDKANECLLVEGYTDVISLHQAGIENVVASGGTSLTTEQIRIIKKFTSNLTIIYDGDSSGIKAALRGLDMALEEGLNVKLVLIPDNEDPDSFVNKVGTTAFKEFIKNNKKDFIIFQLEVILKDAGNDIVLKNNAVNNIADTLSKINRPEDFTKLQEYIKQCAAILKIDELGLTNLVNKFKADKLAKDAKKQANNTTFQQQEFPEQTINTSNDDVSILFNQDDESERNLLKVLLEHGLKQFNQEQTIAEFIFNELNTFYFQNNLIETIVEEYRTAYNEGKQPEPKTFLYHTNNEIRNLVIAITATPYELSVRWDDKLQGMNIVNRDTSTQDALISVNFFKLRKIKKMIDENQHDLEVETDLRKQEYYITVHKELKETEKNITQTLGTVILK